MDWSEVSSAALGVVAAGEDDDGVALANAVAAADDAGAHAHAARGGGDATADEKRAGDGCGGGGGGGGGGGDGCCRCGCCCGGGGGGGAGIRGGIGTPGADAAHATLLGEKADTAAVAAAAGPCLGSCCGLVISNGGRRCWSGSGDTGHAEGGGHGRCGSGGGGAGGATQPRCASGVVTDCNGPLLQG